MTSIEVPYSIAAALPTLSVMDITNEVSKSVASSGKTAGIAYVTATSPLSSGRRSSRTGSARQRGASSSVTASEPAAGCCAKAGC